MFVGHAGSPIFVNFVKWFVDRGHEIAVVSEDKCDLEGISYYNISYKNRSRKGAFGIIYQVRKIRKAIRDFKPVIVHSQQVKLPGILSWLSGFHPHVTSAWGTDVLLLPERSKIQRWFIKQALHHADLITAESVHVKETCLKLGGKRVQLVKNGINFKLIANINIDKQKYSDLYGFYDLYGRIRPHFKCKWTQWTFR